LNLAWYKIEVVQNSMSSTRTYNRRMTKGDGYGGLKAKEYQQFEDVNHTTLELYKMG